MIISRLPAIRFLGTVGILNLAYTVLAKVSFFFILEIWSECYVD